MSAPAAWRRSSQRQKIANASGADMIIANGDDFHVIHRLLDGRNIGTLFVGHLDENFDLVDVLEEDR